MLVPYLIGDTHIHRRGGVLFSGCTRTHTQGTPIHTYIHTSILLLALVRVVEDHDPYLA